MKLKRPWRFRRWLRRKFKFFRDRLTIPQSITVSDRVRKLVMDELCGNRCPHCGSYRVFPKGDWKYAVQCWDCGEQSGIPFFVQDAVLKWPNSFEEIDKIQTRFLASLEKKK